MTREEKLLKIFEIADKNRDLEIKLYWERSKYFFGFITALLASGLGLAAFLIYKYESLNDNALILGSIGLVILSTLLLFFSVGFWLSHKASKFWQENWENILGVLERKIFGDDFVYSVILFREELVENKEKNNKEENQDNKDNDKKKLGNMSEKKLDFKYKYLFHPTKPFFISPSKINANLSIVITIASYLLFVFSFGLLITTLELSNKNEFSLNLKLWSIFIFLNILTISLFIFLNLYAFIRINLSAFIRKIKIIFLLLLLFVPFSLFLLPILFIYIISSVIVNRLKTLILFALFILTVLIISSSYNFSESIYIFMKMLYNLSTISIYNQILYWLYTSIIFSIYVFIQKSVNDFAKNSRKITDNHKHKYLITFNIIDDKDYKNGNFRLEKLYFDELNNSDNK